MTTHRPPTMNAICESVCEYFDLEVDDMLKGFKAPSARRARWVAWWLCHELRRMSYAEIARYFSADHSSIPNAMNALEQDSLLKQQAKELFTSLKNGVSNG